MEPDPWGSRPTSAPPQSYGQAGSRPAAAVALPPRGRPGLIALVAVVVEIVLVAAFGNQGVTKEVVKGAAKTGNETLRNILFSGLTFNWRFSTGGVLRTDRAWAAQLILLGVLFVVTVLLVLAVVRGAVTFGRAFFGTWMAVLVATELGALAAGAIYNPVTQGKPRTFAQAVWNSGGVNAFSFVAGLGLGLVVALIAALFAVATRRAAVVPLAEHYDELPPAQAPPPQPPPYHGEGPTSELPSLRKESAPDQQTQVISREGRDGGAWPSAAVAGIGAGAGTAAASRESRRDTTDESTSALPAQGGDGATGATDATGAYPASRADEPTSAFTPFDPDATRARPSEPAPSQLAPSEPARPSEPAPSEPARPSEPAPSEPARPSEPAPSEPVTPTAPNEPAQPITPPEPSAPSDPFGSPQQEYPTNQTVQLPRFAPGQEPWTTRGEPPQHPAGRSDDTNELPRADERTPPPRFPGSEPDAPQQTHFPRPPNDEDLGHDHHDD